jgi:hypothetical protein
MEAGFDNFHYLADFAHSTCSARFGGNLFSRMNFCVEYKLIGLIKPFKTIEVKDVTIR